MKVASCSKDIAVFRSASEAGVLRELESLTITDAQSVIHRQNDEATADEILVRAIVVGILPSVVPAEQHLARPTAMNIHNRRLSRRTANRPEQLSIGFNPIAGTEGNKFRRDKLRRWEICR